MLIKLASRVLALALICSPAWAGDVGELIRKGDALNAQFKTSEALAVFLQADKESPNDPEVLRRVAREYALTMNDVSGKAAKIEQGEKALDYAKRAVAIDPKNALAQLSLSISYGRLADLLDNKTKIAYAKKVEEHARRSLELDPNNDLTYYVLGAWNYELANLNPILRTVASSLYGDMPPGSNAKAIEYLQKAVALNPNRIGSRVDLGRALIAAGEKEKGRAELKKALTMPSREKDDETARAKAKAAL